MGVELLHNTYAVSCVENYLVATCRYRGLPYQVLYTNSFLNRNQVMGDFLKSEETYIYYTGLPRLQNIAEHISFMRLDYAAVGSDELETEITEQLNLGLPVMVEVDSRVLPSLNGVLPQREDHFILVYASEGNQYWFLDDSPLRNEKIDSDTILQASRGHLLQFVMNRHFSVRRYMDEADTYIDQFIALLRAQQEEELDYYSAEQLDAGRLIYFRDGIGILRSSRKRLSAWLAWLAVQKHEDGKIYAQTAEKISETASLLDRLYNISEMARIRKQSDVSGVCKLMNEYIALERDWIESLLNTGRLPI